MAKTKKRNPSQRKSRSWLSCHAKGLTGRKGAGFHVSKKKQAIKLSCRGKVRYEKSDY